NLAGGNPRRNLWIGERLIAIIESRKGKIAHPSIVSRSPRPGHDFSYPVNADLARRILSWTPLVKLADGLLAVVQWYYNHHPVHVFRQRWETRFAMCQELKPYGTAAQTAVPLAWLNHPPLVSEDHVPAAMEATAKAMQNALMARRNRRNRKHLPSV